MKGISKDGTQKLAAVAVFAMAMGFLESAVVVYLRLLYCPEGFGFPLRKYMDPHGLLIESAREVSTLVMLLGVAYLAAFKWKERFAYFLFVFALWDIFYYVFLKVLLNWPDSFQTSDVLFLIPWPWVAPVLAPVLGSLMLIVLSLCLLNSNEIPNPSQWVLWGVGSFAVLTTFLSDFGRVILGSGHLKQSFNLAANPGFQEILANHVPGNYDWILFMAGEALIGAGIYIFSLEGKK